ncbi:MAG: SMC-Scp complex subunit ScpB [Gammaproteobacteria bacterium]|nr:SMC-Scp complex subunit ScpB [Gammaproteobacteria bacterium]
MSTNPPPIKDIIEAALLCADQPLTLERLAELFDEDARPAPEEFRAALDTIAAEWDGRTLELKQVSSGYRLQVRQEFATWVGRLAEERAPRYSRALLETLALIVYRQPITRAGIEEIRGVSVSTYIIKTLLEREWVRVVGHRDVPGKPALYGTTRKFLDYFNLESLSELPALADIKPIDHLQKEMDLAAAAADDAAAAAAVSEPGEVYSMEAARQPAVNDADPEGAAEDADAEARETAEAIS